jgi:hypothetical protein
MISVGCHRHTDVTVDIKVENDARLLDATRRFTVNIDVKRIVTVTEIEVENEMTEIVNGAKILEAGKLIL